MSESLISVIICVYNGEKYLAEAIECVLMQDHKNVELIVVDDGSTDTSADLARGYREVILVQHAKNKGLPAARNTGIGAATGDYIAFLDADDKWPLNKLSVQLAFHQESPHYRFSYTLEEFVFQDGAARPNWTEKPILKNEHVAYCAGSMLFERSVFTDVGVFDEDISVGDGTEWIFRAKDLGYTGGVVNKVLLQRRIHDDNISTRVDEGLSNLFKFVKGSIDRQKGGSTDE